MIALSSLVAVTASCSSMSATVSGQPKLGAFVANVTPRGWAPVAGAKLEVSVPDRWAIEPQGGFVCGGGIDGWVFVGQPARQLPECRQVPNVVVMRPFTAVPATYRSEQPKLVNGLPVLLGPRHGASVTYYVPSLRQEVIASGLLAGQVVSTLTRSPLTVVLAGGARPFVPDNWRRLTFAGITFFVPNNWPVQRQGWPWCSFGTGGHEVWLMDFNSRKDLAAPNCPGPFLTAVASAGSDGVTVATGRYAPHPGSAMKLCLHPHDLTACVTRMSSTELDLEIDRPGRSNAYVNIGIAGNGITARTILYSLASA